MIAIDFITDFSPNVVAAPNTSRAELLQQLESHRITLALATSRRGLQNQVNREAIEETLEGTIDCDRLLPVGTLDPRRYVEWRQDLELCIDIGCVAVRFAPGTQNWTADTMLFAEMVSAVSRHQLPIIVDFDGAGTECMAWIGAIGELTADCGVPVALNEVPYHYVGELITAMHAFPTVDAGIRRLFLAGSLELAFTQGLIDRFLFASNAPRYSVQGLFYHVLGADLPDSAKQAVLAGNALRLQRKQLPASPRETAAQLDLPPESIIDVHAHVSRFFLPQPIDSFDCTTVPQMSEKCNIELTIVSSYHAIGYDMAVGNDQTASLLEQYPTLRGYVVCDARDVAGSVLQMERYFADSRFVGV